VGNRGPCTAGAAQEARGGFEACQVPNAIHGLEQPVRSDKISTSSPLLLLLLLRTTYSAATGSTAPQDVSAGWWRQAHPHRLRARGRAHRCRHDADAATASTEPSRSLLEEHEAELEALEAQLAAVRADTKKKQLCVDYAEANLNLTADLLERMKEEIGDLRLAADRLGSRIHIREWLSRNFCLGRVSSERWGSPWG
jgi:hypothetical protein